MADKKSVIICLTRVIRVPRQTQNTFQIVAITQARFDFLLAALYHQIQKHYLLQKLLPWKN